MSIRAVLKKHRTKLLCLVLYSALIGYPAWLTHANPPPDESTAQVVRGVVVEAKREQPHLRVRLSDGHVEDFQFPGELIGILFGKHQRFSEATDHELQELIGCKSELKVDRIRYFPLPVKARVWSVRCERVHLPYSRLVGYYNNQSRFSAGKWFIALSAALMLLASAIRDARDAAAARSRAD